MSRDTLLPKQWTDLLQRGERAVSRLEHLATWGSVLVVTMTAAGFLAGLFFVIRSLPHMVPQ